MSTQQPPTPDDYAYYISTERKTREEAELKLKESRERSRFHVLAAITQGGFSIQKAANLSGHNRATITLWLQVHNAENRSAQPPAAAAGAQDKK